MPKDASSIIRVARPSDDPEGLLPFYCGGLGLTVLTRFEDHDGVDGIVVGLLDAPYQFEFTRRPGRVVGRAPSGEHLVVFYFSDHALWSVAVEHMANCGFERVPSTNPYWERTGATFEDPDGYRIVLQCEVWSADDPAAADDGLAKRG